MDTFDPFERTPVSFQEKSPRSRSLGKDKKETFDPFERTPVSFPEKSLLSSSLGKDTREEFYRDLQLTKSKAEKVDTMIDREVQLRLEIALLEAEATSKKRAAEDALLSAMNALNEVKSSDADEDDDAGVGTKGNMANAEDLLSINGTIDAVAKIMRDAREEAAEGREGPASPPAIVRRTEIDGNEVEDGLKVTTSILSDDEYDQAVYSPTSQRRVRNHADTMEDTLDTIMFKIEECTAIISDPNSSMEDQLSAAQLVSQYAKAAKAFQASF